MTKEELLQAKERADAVVLAHYYVPEEVQAIADCVGDSFYLAKIAADTEKQTIVFCGVRFMGESAKILNPSRRVLLPDESADCPMAHMASAEQIARLRAEVPDLAVVCYINSSAALKGLSDVCVTSSNAVKIVRALPNKNILFIPDENLGRWVQKKVPEKNFYFSGGHCPVHACLTAEAGRGSESGAPRGGGGRAPRVPRRDPRPRRFCGQHLRDHRLCEKEACGRTDRCHRTGRAV